MKNQNHLKMQKTFNDLNDRFRVKEEYETPEKKDKFMMLSYIFNILSIALVTMLCLCFKLGEIEFIIAAFVWFIFACMLEFGKRHFGTDYKSCLLASEDEHLTKEERGKAFELSEVSKKKFYAMVILSVSLAACAGYFDSYLFVTSSQSYTEFSVVGYSDSTFTPTPYDLRYDNAVRLAEQNHKAALSSDPNDIGSHRKAFRNYDAALAALNEHRKSVDEQNQVARSKIETFNKERRTEVDRYNKDGKLKNEAYNKDLKKDTKRDAILYALLFCGLSVLIESFSLFCLNEYLEVSFGILQSYKRNSKKATRKGEAVEIEIENQLKAKSLTIVEDEHIESNDDIVEAELLKKLAAIQKRKSGGSSPRYDISLDETSLRNPGRTVIQGFRHRNESPQVVVNDMSSTNPNFLTCPQCGNLFEKKNYRHTYCTEQCRVVAWEERNGRKMVKKVKS